MIRDNVDGITGIDQGRIKLSTNEESWKHDMYHQIYDKHFKLEDQPASSIRASEQEDNPLGHPEYEVPVHDIFRYPVEKVHVGSVSMDRDLVSRSDGNMNLVVHPGMQTNPFIEQDADELPSPLRRPLSFTDVDSSCMEDTHSEFSISLQSPEASKPAETLPTPSSSEKTPGKYVLRRPNPNTKVPLRRPKCAPSTLLLVRF